MYTCQYCGKPCGNQVPCAGCHALFYCTSKHRAAHQRHGGHDKEECGRMAQQLAAGQELEQPCFPWWSLLNPPAGGTNTSTGTDAGQQDLSAITTLLASQADQGQGDQQQWPHTLATVDMLEACSQAHQRASGRAAAAPGSAGGWPAGCLTPHPASWQGRGTAGRAAQTEPQAHEPPAGDLCCVHDSHHHHHHHHHHHCPAAGYANNQGGHQRPDQQAAAPAHPIVEPVGRSQQDQLQPPSPQQQQQGQQPEQQRHEQQQQQQAKYVPLGTAPRADDEPQAAASQAVRDWPSVLQALRLPADGPSALVLHFAASLAHALCTHHHLMLAPAQPPHSTPPHHPDRPPKDGGGCGNYGVAPIQARLPQAPGLAGPQPGSSSSSRSGQPGPDATGGDGAADEALAQTTLHILYLGPEVECALLDSFQSLQVLLQPVLAALQQAAQQPCQGTHLQAPSLSRDGTTESLPQVWLHFIGPAVPEAWHGCAGTFQQPRGLPVSPGLACDLHATFWHGCLHEVAPQLSAWLHALAPPHVPQHGSSGCQQHQARAASSGIQLSSALPTSLTHQRHGQSQHVPGSGIQPTEDCSTCCLPPGPSPHPVSKRPRHHSPPSMPPATPHGADLPCGGCHDPACGQGAACLWAALAGTRVLVWAPNAGLVAYPTWLPTLDLLASCCLCPSLLTTDFCEEALIKAQLMMAALYPEMRYVVEPAPNPLRQPWRQVAHGNALPAYSNGFTAGWKRSGT